MKEQKNKYVWLLAVLMALLLTPLLVEYFDFLSERKHYKWFPVLAVIWPTLFWLKWRQAPAAEDRPRSAPQYFLVFASLLTTAVGYLYYVGWVGMIATILALGALLSYVSRARKMDGLFALWALLFLFVRLPFQVEGRVLRLFQGISSKVASVMVDFSGAYHVVQGNSMLIEGHEIRVDHICNGYFSVVSVVVLAALHAYWRKRTIPHTSMLILGAFGCATVVNALRVGTVGIIFSKTGVDIMQGAWIVAFAVVSFILAYLLILSTDALWSFLFKTVELDRDKRQAKWLVKGWNFFADFSLGRLLAKWRKPKEIDESPSIGVKVSKIALIVSLLALTSFESVVLYYRWGYGDYQTYFMHDKESLAIIDPNRVEIDRPGWQVISVEVEERDASSIWGAYSFIWTVQYHDVVAKVALDYPFDKWHDVKVCYSGLGWKVESEESASPESFKGWNASQTEMIQPTGDYAFVLCSHCDHEGQPVQAKPTAHQINMVMYYLHPKQWTAPFGTSVDKNKNTFYQTQLMLTSAFPLDEAMKEEVLEMYADFREQTRALIEEESQK